MPLLVAKLHWLFLVKENKRTFCHDAFEKSKISKENKISKEDNPHDEGQFLLELCGTSKLKSQSPTTEVAKQHSLITNNLPVPQWKRNPLNLTGRGWCDQSNPTGQH